MVTENPFGTRWWRKTQFATRRWLHVAIDLTIKMSVFFFFSVSTSDFQDVYRGKFAGTSSAAAYLKPFSCVISRLIIIKFRWKIGVFWTSLGFGLLVYFSKIVCYVKSRWVQKISVFTLGKTKEIRAGKVFHGARPWECSKATCGPWVALQRSRPGSPAGPAPASCYATSTRVIVIANLLKTFLRWNTAIAFFQVWPIGKIITHVSIIQVPKSANEGISIFRVQFEVCFGSSFEQNLKLLNVWQLRSSHIEI